MATAMTEGRRGLAVLMGLVLGVGGTIVTLRSIANAWTIERHAGSMKEARGEVLDVVESHSRYGSSYRVRFAYEVDGRRYEGNTDLTGALSHPRELDRCMSGPPGREHLRVYYLPQKPEFAVLTLETSIDSQLLMLLLFAGCLAVSVFLFTRGRRGAAPFTPVDARSPDGA